jgi:hypothetical protein
MLSIAPNDIANPTHPKALLEFAALEHGNAAVHGVRRQIFGGGPRLHDPLGKIRH